MLQNVRGFRILPPLKKFYTSRASFEPAQTIASLPFQHFGSFGSLTDPLENSPEHNPVPADPWTNIRSTAAMLIDKHYPSTRSSPQTLANSNSETTRDNLTMVPRSKFALLRHRRTWELYPCKGSDYVESGCAWVLLVQKLSIFSLSDAEAVLRLQEELRSTPNITDNVLIEGAEGESGFPPPPPAITSQYLADVRMRRRPPWLLVVAGKPGASSSLDYRAAARLRMEGADVWPVHRLREMLSPALAPPFPGATTAEDTPPSPFPGDSAQSALKSRPPGPTGTAVSGVGASGGRFHLQAPYVPTGDQPGAIAALCRGLDEKKRFMAFKGATGTGKTFVMANVIEHAQKPTLVLAPNKVSKVSCL